MIRRPLLIVFIIFFATRLINLTLLPIFTDESNYLEWGYREIHDKGQAFMSLYDAKQPFAMWLYGIAQTLSPGDPLWASRFISVIAGALNLWGIYLISQKLFNQKTAVISALLYITLPFFIFFDRQALMETMIITSSVWSFYFLLRLHDKFHPIYAVLAGIILGIGFLIKNTSLIFLVTFVLTHLYLSVVNKEQSIRLLNLGLLMLLSFLVISAPLLFQPQFWSTFHTNERFAYTLPQLLTFPVSAWIKNFLGNTEMLLINFTPPLFVFAGMGLYQLIRLKKIPITVLVSWTILPLLQYLIYFNSFSSSNFRYITPFTPFFIFPMAYFLSCHLKLTILCLVLPITALLLLIFSPIQYFTFKSKITKYSHMAGYVTGSGTGYQVQSLRNYIDNKAKSGRIFIGMKSASFNPTAAIFVYYRKSPTAKVAFFDKGLFGNQLDHAECLTTSLPFYYIAYSEDLAGMNQFLRPLDIVTSPYTTEVYHSYTLKTGCPADKTVKINPVDTY